ncbi:uncharacterized protein LOC130282866 [Hyla sarda]|uniref:uncharacterized protein LOC130282866 n=1 Tax=Hyla sarda TaxID=327740 RepID=UPI0024C397FB|nr:uncharacterized protein LOC130282866 [Hyla sarda]
MTISTVRTEKGNVSCETSEGTVVNISITQRSALDCLLDTFRFFRDMKKSGQKTEPSRVSGAAQLGFGVAYISLGLLSVMLAIIIAIVQPDWRVFYSGVHFWVGFPFLVSGILNLVAYKYRQKFWMALAFISILVDFGVSIAGIVIEAGDVDRLSWHFSEDICSNLRNRRRNYWEPTTAPRYDYGSDYELERCKAEMQSYKNLQTGLIIMTLLMMIWGLCLSILHVGCKVRSCYRSCKLERTEEEDDALIKPNPSDDIIIA